MHYRCVIKPIQITNKVGIIVLLYCFIINHLHNLTEFVIISARYQKLVQTDYDLFFLVTVIFMSFTLDFLFRVLKLSYLTSYFV